MLWNKDSWKPSEEELLEYTQTTRTGVQRDWDWNAGIRKNYVRDARFFILRVRDSRGIVGSGRIKSDELIPNPHWEEDRQDEEVMYVDCKLDVFLPIEDRLSIEELRRATPDYKWHCQGSGTLLPASSEEVVWNRWEQHLSDIGWGEFTNPEEIKGEMLQEGTKRTVTVNRYERNSKARRACIDHHGLDCAVCEFNFESVYGEIGEGYIHVHHLRDIAKIGEEYQINPIEDLRPVCPNCHAMLHTKIPAMSIETLRKMLKQ